MKKKNLLLISLLAAALAACSSVAGGEENEHELVEIDPSDENSTKDENKEENKDGALDTSEVALDNLVEMVDIPAMTYSRGSISYKVNAYSISKTEVTEGQFSKVMGSLPEKANHGDNYPVTEVTWYDAALFCNALSKASGYDTAYVYDSVDNNGALVNLSVAYGVKSLRLPTEMEWEIAARAGTSTTYYWDTDEASKYAYYGQSKGPAAVASYTPNAYGLYDMSGNVGEWMNDWYDAYPTTSQENYTGPLTGKYKVLRGGGWTDKVTALASSERDKKEPLYASQTAGFRIVYSAGI